MSKEANKKKNPLMHLVAGGAAGLVESSVCHPLDTIKTRMQLRRQATSVEKVVVKLKHSLQEPAFAIETFPARTGPSNRQYGRGGGS
jgi:hypothetical protein